VATEILAKATLRQRAEHELKELAIISAYLYVTLDVTAFRRQSGRPSGREF